MILIKNAMVLIDEKFLKRDVLIDNEKIIKIDRYINNKDNCRILNVDGKYLLPSLIDLNVRLLNDVLSKKNLDKLLQSAKKGGVGTVVLISDFTPRLDSSTLLDFIKSYMKELDISFKITAPLVDASNEKLNNIATLINNGASAIWSGSGINSNLLKRGMQYSIMKDTPLFCFCYDPNLDDHGVMNDGRISSKLGLSGISKFAESVEVARVSELSVEFASKVLFQTVSTDRSLEILKNAKEYNPNLCVEVSIHHLLKSDICCDEFNTYAKILPPLRDEEERKKLIKRLKNGDIDILTSAHSPKSVLYKDVAFKEALFGMGSIEEFFKLAYTYLVKGGEIDLGMLVKMTSENPARFLGLNSKGKIEEGYDADCFIFDANKSEIFRNDTSIYNNEILYGELISLSELIGFSK